MATIAPGDSIHQTHETALPLAGTPGEYSPLLDLIGEARYVLLGEASHGSHEFYKARAEITKRLILEKGVTVIAWEADWPDALRVSRYIRGKGRDQSALEALGGFQRFPQWMWRNADILELVGWLRAHNDRLPPRGSKVGIYGLDLYSLHASIHAVIAYLEQVDPEAAKAARQRYACFEDFGEDPQAYGLVASADRSLSCEDEVVQQLVELQRNAANFLSRDGRPAADELFYAEQNARVAMDAERYYRAMYRGRLNTWNFRDTHMVDTLELLLGHLQRQGESSKAVVWAHNSHLGDARATEMSRRGELNVGQLLRERRHEAVCSVGFTTYSGTVTAASDWDAPAERKRVRPGLEGSYEALFHEVALSKFLLLLRGGRARHLPAPLLERAIGVVYRPETERWSHYFEARLADQFDAVLHFDQSRAVEPLERTSEWEAGELPETYPSGI
jgi:erythromycin esterase-like protein